MRVRCRIYVKQPILNNPSSVSLEERIFRVNLYQVWVEYRSSTDAAREALEVKPYSQKPSKGN